MPVNLTTPQTLVAEKPLSFGTLKIRVFQVDAQAKTIKAWWTAVDGAVEREIGSLVLENLPEPRTYSFAGLALVAAAGAHFDDAVAADFAGTSIYARTKAALYARFAAVFPALAGTVS